MYTTTIFPLRYCRVNLRTVSRVFGRFFLGFFFSRFTTCKYDVMSNTRSDRTRVAFSYNNNNNNNNVIMSPLCSIVFGSVGSDPVAARSIKYTGTITLPLYSARMRDLKRRRNYERSVLSSGLCAHLRATFRVSCCVTALYKLYILRPRYVFNRETDTPRGEAGDSRYLFISEGV